MSGDGTAEAFRDAVAARAAGTPYVVVDTPAGFDLRIDLADAAWYGLLAKAGRKKVVQHRVLVDGAARRFTMVDDHYDVEWQVGLDPSGPGVPRLRAARQESRTLGRVHEFSMEKTVGVSTTTHRPEVVVDYVFRSSDGQGMIRDAAEQAGWRERRGAAERVGIVAGVVGGIGAVAALVAGAVIVFF